MHSANPVCRARFDAANILHHCTHMLRHVHCSANVQQQQQHQQAVTAELSPQQAASLAALQQVFSPLEVEKLVSSKPSVLDLPTGDWLEFFEGYRLSKAVQWRTLRYSTHELADPFTAGAAIRWLKQLGPWTDADVAERLLPCYPKVCVHLPATTIRWWWCRRAGPSSARMHGHPHPGVIGPVMTHVCRMLRCVCWPQVLATSDASLSALYDHVRGLGFTHEDVQALLWEFPGLMADFREELLPLITRMVESRRNKYTNGGLYVD